MPDLISIANDLKTAPDQWLVQQSQKPSGTTPPYLVLAELQRRQLLRGGSSGKPPSTSVAQDTVAATIKQIAPPKPEGPPPPPGMAPPAKGMPSGQPGGPIPGAKPPQNMAAGGAVEDDEEDESIPELIRFFSQKYDIDPQIPLAIAKNETRNFDKKAVSPKGASGPMQLMPATARQLGVKDIFDPTQNVEAGVRYAKEMLDLHHGNIPNAIAAYNAGPGAVKKFGGIPPYKETQDYVQKAMKHLNSRQTQPLRAAPSTPNPFRLNQEPRLPRGPIELLEDSTKIGRKMMPPPAKANAAPAASPFPPDAGAGPLPEGPVELPEPEAPFDMPDEPALPEALGSITAPAGPKATGLAAWEPPESEALKSARSRLTEAKQHHKQRQEEGGIERVHAAVQAVMGKRTDYSELEAAIAELTKQAEQSLHPSIGQTLQAMGLALLASNQPFGQAMGSAGLHAMGIMEKQRQEARSNYIAALKAGVDLQSKKSSYDEKMAQLSLGESRVRQTEIEGARKEAVAAQEKFDKIVSESPSAQMEGRLNAINQWRASNNLAPVAKAGDLSEEEQNYVKFGSKPSTAQDNKNTLAMKAAAGDPQAQDAIDILNKKQNFQNYISGKKTAAAAVSGAPATVGAPAPPEAVRATPEAEVVRRRGTLPIPVDDGKRDEAVLAKLPPEEQALVRAIANYDVELSSRTMNNEEWQNRMKAAMLYNPDFNQGEYRNRQKLRQKYTSGKGADNINSLNTVTDHLDRLEKNWAAFDNWGGWMTPANRPLNALRSFTGDARIGPFIQNQEGVGTELMRVWRQVGASSQEIEKWKEGLGMNASPAAQASTIREMYHMIQGKLASAKKEYEDGMGRPADFHLLTPKTAERFRAHGVPFEDIDPGYEGGPAAPAAPAAPAKTITKQKVQKAANEHFGGDYKAAAKAFEETGYTIQ